MTVQNNSEMNRTMQKRDEIIDNYSTRLKWTKTTGINFFNDIFTFTAIKTLYAHLTLNM